MLYFIRKNYHYLDKIENESVRFFSETYIVNQK